jgi:N-acetylglucosamine kinase-like BadF-type ATPase
LCESAQVERNRITHAFLALGGLDTEQDRLEFNAVIPSLFPQQTTEWQVENDVLAALYSGTLGKPGMVLLAGTGSMAMALDIRGKLLRSGGWGSLVGRDPGSAFYVGQMLLAHVMREYDKGHEPDALARMVMAQAGVETPHQLIDWVEGAVSPTGQVAQAAKTVDAAAVQGNELAEQILVKAAKTMVEHFWMLVPQLDYSGMDEVPVVLAGGMFKSALYKETVQQLILAAGKPWRAVVPAVPPVGGSFVGVLQLAGLPVTGEVMKRFAQTLAQVKQ